MKAKKKKKNSSHRLKNHLFLSLTSCLCLSPKSLSFHSLSQITLSSCLSFSLKSLLLSQITHHQALILSTQPSQGPKSLTVAPFSPSLLSHRHALSLSSLTPLLVGFDYEIRLTVFDCFVVVLRWVFMVVLRRISWLCSGEFHGYEIGFMGWWGDGVVVCGGAIAVVDSWWS